MSARNQSPNGVLCLCLIDFNFFMLVPNFVKVGLERLLLGQRGERDFQSFNGAWINMWLRGSLFQKINCILQMKHGII